jgi:hypothetical protein
MYAMHISVMAVAEKDKTIIMKSGIVIRLRYRAENTPIIVIIYPARALMFIMSSRFPVASGVSKLCICTFIIYAVYFLAYMGINFKILVRC